MIWYIKNQYQVMTPIFLKIFFRLYFGPKLLHFKFLAFFFVFKNKNHFVKIHSSSKTLFPLSIFCLSRFLWGATPAQYSTRLKTFLNCTCITQLLTFNCPTKERELSLYQYYHGKLVCFMYWQVV